MVYSEKKEATSLDHIGVLGCKEDMWLVALLLEWLKEWLLHKR